MPAEERGIHYRSSEFIYRNWHYAKGWYFYDEEEDLYGPFPNEKFAKIALQLYIKQLMEGRSPTQLTEKEKRILTPHIERAIAEMEHQDPDIPEDLLTEIIKNSQH